MEQQVFPVDVISVCSADGDIRPLRMRLKEDGYQFIRIDIDEVVSIKHIPYVGVESQVFLCRATVRGKPLLFELKYAIRTHSWSLTRRMY